MDRKRYLQNYQKEWAAKNRDKILARQRKYAEDNPAKRLFYNAKYRAKYKGIPFDLVEEDVVIPAICPILGIPLFKSPGKHPCSNSPSLDKIDPILGYTKHNIQVISHRANVMKNDASPEELVQFANWVYTNYVGGT